MTVAEKAAKAAELRDKALDMLEVAEGRLVRIEAPPALIKTEKDFRDAPLRGERDRPGL
jgi:hypothetical protein